MKNTKKTLLNSKEKLVGKAKGTLGKATGNKKMELQGKIQSTKADLKTKAHQSNKNITKKVNDIIDKTKKNIKHK